MPFPLFQSDAYSLTLNLHNEESIRLLHQAGSDWAFYNGGNRWTYGIYMYKAVKQFDMKFRVSWYWNIVAGRSPTTHWIASRGRLRLVQHEIRNGELISSGQLRTRRTRRNR